MLEMFIVYKKLPKKINKIYRKNVLQISLSLCNESLDLYIEKTYFCVSQIEYLRNGWTFFSKFKNIKSPPFKLSLASLNDN